LVLRQKWHSIFDRLHHLRFRLANAYSTDCVTIEADLHQHPRALFPQSCVTASLHNPEYRLAVRPWLVAAFLRPTQRAFDCSADFFGACGMRRTIVEHHCDVRPKHALNFHRLFRSEEEQCAIEM
jgi:hypothetical protein